MIKWTSKDMIADPMIKKFAAICESNNSQSLIENVDTEIRFVDVNGKYTFPITINHTEWNNSYVCSPYTAFVLYSEEEVKRKLSNKPLQFSLILIIRLFSIFLKKAQINKVVHVNNFMLSTNPYPDWEGEYIEEIINFLISEFPGHAIIFRSLNDVQNTSLMNELSTSGLMLLASRQVYIYKEEYKVFIKHNNNYQDNRIIRNKKLTYVNHEEMGNYLEEALELYNLLYLEKYSYYNPRFTSLYFQDTYKSGLIYFQGYKDDAGKLKCFSGLFTIADTITSPLVGYDTKAHQRDALYIHAINLIYKYKFKTGKTLNLSSGAPKFKRLRGGKPSIEYAAVYINHLSLFRRFVFKFLKFISNSIGAPLLKKYEL